jgi:hypothetical protein
MMGVRFPPPAYSVKPLKPIDLGGFRLRKNAMTLVIPQREAFKGTAQIKISMLKETTSPADQSIGITS